MSLPKDNRRFHQKMFWVLKDWYGPSRARVESVSYCPDSVQVGDLIDSVIEKALPKDGVALLEVKADWTKYVGAQLAKFSEPISIRDKVIEVAVSHPAWIREMQGPVKKTIIKNINASCGEDFCVDLKFIPSGR